MNGIVRRGAKGLRRDAFVYAEVSDEPGRRDSYDVNLYKSGMRLAEIAEAVLRIGQAYEIPETPLAAHLTAHRDCRLGHVSGGGDRNGAGFVTFYYEVDHF